MKIKTSKLIGPALDWSAADRRKAMFRDTKDGCTNFYCGCTSTRTYTNGICDTCGGVDGHPRGTTFSLTGDSGFIAGVRVEAPVRRRKEGKWSTAQ